MNFFYKLLIIFTLFIGQSIATIPRVYFEKNIQINLRQYDQYLMPQIQGIINDFNDLINVLAPEVKPFIQVVFDINKNKERLNFFKDQCIPITNKEDCLSLINEVEEGWLKINQKMFAENINFQKILSRDRQSLKESKPYFRVQEIFMKQQIHSLSSVSYFSRIRNRIYYGSNIKSEIVDLIKFHMNHQIYVENILLEFVPETINEQVKEVWANFIRPLMQNYKLPKRNIFLCTNLGNLNIGWNSFNLYLEKKKEFRAHSGIAENIQNRWNSILKLLLN